jgi:ankyrin repeat protein
MINQFTIIEILLMYGANINKKDKYGNTSLMYAVDRHNLESINSLMKNGSNRY